MRLLAIITLCKTGVALSHPHGGADTPANPLRHMTNDPKWKSAESELLGFYTRTSLPESEVMSLNEVMNRIFEEHHSTLSDWPGDEVQTDEADASTSDFASTDSTVTVSPTTITITDADIETVTEESLESTADNTATVTTNPETESSAANVQLQSGITPTPYSEVTSSAAVPSPASTGSSNDAPTQSFGVVLLALGAFFL